MAKTLNDAPSIYSEPPVLKEGLSAFSNVKSDFSESLYAAESEEGFDEAYEHPRSWDDGSGKPSGRYMNLTDIRMMYYLGTEYAKKRLIGMKPVWDRSFCQAIGGYPNGAILRHPSGRKMVSRRSKNTDAMPDEYKTTDGWAVVKPAQGFRGIADHFLYPQLNFQPPIVTTTQTYVVPMDIQFKGVYSFPMMFCAQNQFWWESDLCEEGNVTLRISKYNDVLTNQSHSGNYVTAGKIITYDIPRQKKRKFFDPVPLVPGRYYAYIEYDNARATDRGAIGGPYTRNYRLVCQIASPTVYWPKY